MGTLIYINAACFSPKPSWYTIRPPGRMDSSIIAFCGLDISAQLLHSWPVFQPIMLVSNLTKSRGIKMKSILLLIPALAMLASCTNVDTPTYKIVGTVARPRIELTAESNDVITAIHVTEGETIRSGTVIAEQDPTLYQTRLDQSLAVRDRLAARLAELERGPRPELISAARAKLQGTVSNLAIREREYSRVSRLVTDKLASASLLDQALEHKDLALAAHDQARAELEALLAGSTTEEIDQIKASQAEAEALIRTQQTLLQRLRIVASRDGIIDSLPYETGERPLPGSTLAVMLANQLPYARVYIPEPIRTQIKSGTVATILVDGMTTAFQGKVRYVSAEAAFTPHYALTQRDRSRLSFLAEIDFIDDSAAAIPVGVPVEVRFPELDTNADN